MFKNFLNIDLFALKNIKNRTRINFDINYVSRKENICSMIILLLNIVWWYDNLIKSTENSILHVWNYY